MESQYFSCPNVVAFCLQAKKAKEQKVQRNTEIFLKVGVDLTQGNDLCDLCSNLTWCACYFLLTNFSCYWMMIQ